MFPKSQTLMPLQIDLEQVQCTELKQIKKNSEKQTKEPNQQKYSNIRETDFFFPNALEGIGLLFVLYQHFLLR